MADYDDCVERKIAKLIEEGKERDQAVAIAHEMCKEEKALAEKYAMRYSQAEVHYTPDYQGTEGRCASCRWFIAHSEYGEGCTIVENYPADVLPTGRCDKQETIPPPPDPYVQLVQIVEGTAEVTPTAEAETVKTSLPIPEVAKQQSLIALIKATVGDLLHKRIATQPSGFKVYDNHWVGWWTNNAEDREAEWFPAKAIDDYVDRVDVGVIPQPDLWFWHIPGSRHGTAEWQGRIEHYCVAVGSFDDTQAGKAARAHYTQSKARYSMSHGFAYDKTQYLDGAYHQFNTFELSVLPPHVAANPYTDFEGLKQMALTPEKVQALEALVGKDIAQQIIADTEAKSKALDELGVQFKDYVQVSTTEPVSKQMDDCMKQQMDEGMSEADARAKCKDEKALREQKDLTGLFVDILKDQAGMVTIVDAMGKAMKARDEATNKVVEDLKADLAVLQKEFELRPRVASKDDETVEDESKINADIVKDMHQTKADPFWNPAG